MLPWWGCQVTKSGSPLPSGPSNHVPGSPRSCRSPSSPVPRVLAPTPWWPAGLGRLSGTRGCSPRSSAQLLSLVTLTLERNELSFNFLCLKRQALWACLRIAVGWSELAKMGVGGGCGWCTAAVGGHLWGAPSLACGVLMNQVHRLDEDREKQGSRFTKGWGVPSWERDGAREQRSRSWGAQRAPLGGQEAGPG